MKLKFLYDCQTKQVIVLIVCVEPNKDEEDINICVEFSSKRTLLTNFFSCYYHNNLSSIILDSVSSIRLLLYIGFLLNE